MNNYGQIIAIGGGGFGRNPNKPVIEEYILELSNTSKPRIAFFPTASAVFDGKVQGVVVQAIK